MGLFKKRQTTEVRADPAFTDDPILISLFGDGNEMTKAKALQIPAVASSITLIGDLISSTPIKLYRETADETQEVKDDQRLRILNDDTGDTLSASDFWRAMVRDYFLGKGGYAYIRRQFNDVTGLFYVPEEIVGINMGTDPIFKDYDILVNGNSYRPHEFLKILRNTKDGARGSGVVDENGMMLATAYAALAFEKSLMKKAGSRKGFLKSQASLSEAAFTQLKNAFRKLNSNDENSENVVVLNKGVEWQDAGQSATEMQIHENKVTNGEEISKIFHVPVALMTGNVSNAQAAETVMSNTAKIAVIPVLRQIETALNRDLLLESEKGNMYFAFDTKELLKGGMKERFEAYGIGIDKNILQVDEVRYMEDMKPLGIDFIKLGLQDVLYDPKTKSIYTPNTGIRDDITMKGGKKK